MNVSLGREFFSLVFRWNFLICLVFWLFLKKNHPKKVHRFDKTTHTQFGTETCLAWKPSLKIGSVNKAFLFWYWQRLNFFFFRNKTFLFFKIESWNFQNLFEKEFRETSQNFNSIRQPIEKMKITIVWISWMSWNFVRFHEI